MNNIQHQLAVKQALQSRFKGQGTIDSKVKPLYPMSPEREAVRIANAYMKLVHQSIKKHLPNILAAYKRGLEAGTRHDDDLDFQQEVRQEILRIHEELEQALAKYGVQKFLETVANMGMTVSTREWKRIVRQTFGIDLMNDYYSGEFYAEILRKWVDEHVQKISTIPNQALDDMRDVIYEGYRNGKTIRDITKDIQESYNVSKSKAKMLARDQIASLNAAITKHQQTDAGVSRYVWSTSGDSRVRDCHKALDGKVFSWDDPPEMWYDTKGRGRVYTGRRCHPGEDYCCRCVAIPKFDIDTLDIPMAETE